MPVTAEKNASGMSKRSAMGTYSSIWAAIVCPLENSFELYVGTDPCGAPSLADKGPKATTSEEAEKTAV